MWKPPFNHPTYNLFSVVYIQVRVDLAGTMWPGGVYGACDRPHGYYSPLLTHSTLSRQCNVNLNYREMISISLGFPVNRHMLHDVVRA